MSFKSEKAVKCDPKALDFATWRDGTISSLDGRNWFRCYVKREVNDSSLLWVIYKHVTNIPGHDILDTKSKIL